MKKILWVLLTLALLYGILCLGEIITTQELQRASNPQTDETVCLMWKPRLFRGDGVCYVKLLNAKGKTVDTAKLPLFDTGLNALQRYGQIDFQGQNISLSGLRSGEPGPRFVVRDGHLNSPD